MSDLDRRDRAILTERTRRMDADDAIRVGDFVLFSDGVLRRVAHLYSTVVQTCDLGDFYLDIDVVRMSGSLSPGITRDTLTPTRLSQLGVIAFHHHDQRATGTLIRTQVPFRVYQCSEPSEDRWCRGCNGRVWGGHRHGVDDGAPPRGQQLRASSRTAARDAARGGDAR